MNLPHNYSVSTKGGNEGPLELSADGLPTLAVAAPANFGGPGDCWSPEDLLVGAVANCLVLSFKAIARASRLEWIDLQCNTEGTLEKTDEGMRFTQMINDVKLVIKREEDRDKAERLLHKAEKSCLITNSLSCECQLKLSIDS